MIFLEFSDESSINQDVAVSLMEQISSDLSLINDQDRVFFVNNLTAISEHYTDDKKEFIKSLPENLGLL
jgi:hypothetical protein